MPSKLTSFFRNFFKFEPSYFTVGGWRRNLVYFLRLGNIPAHLVDRIKFRIYPKLLLVPGFPTHLEVEAASACQMRCPMCYTTYMPEELKGIMPWDLYTKIIDEASKSGVYSIKLSWRGEPLLNKNLTKMVRYAKEKGIKDLAFLTNAELLTREIAMELVDAGLDWMSVSADGVGDIYNEIRAPAVFEETIERVLWMKQYRDSKGLKKPLLRVQSIMSAVENDAEVFHDSWKNVVDRINVIADQIRDFENRDDLEFDPFFMCPKPWQRMTIAYDGKVHQCIADYGAKNIVGDVRQQSLREIWHGEANESVRRAFREHKYLEKNDPCKFCSYGLVQEKGTIAVDTEMEIRRFKSVPKVVDEDEVRLRTPEDKLPRRLKTATEAAREERKREPTTP